LKCVHVQSRRKKQQQQMNAMSFFKINKDTKNRRPN
jgi:hypothetical protein